MWTALVIIVVVVAVLYLAGKRSFYLVASATFDDINYRELFDFVTNIANDHKWYAGIETTQLRAEGSEDFVGKQYLQNGKFNGIPFENKIEVMKTALDKDRIFLSFIGTGTAVWYTVTYLFEPTATGACFTNISTVSNLRFGYLVSDPAALFDTNKSCEALKAYTEASLKRLALALGKNSHVEIEVVKMMSL
jgi:hypothetical protein